MSDVKVLGDEELRGGIEALLLVATEPVSARSISVLTGCPVPKVNEVLANLRADYEASERGFQLVEVAGGWRLMTHPAYHELITRFIGSLDSHRLTQAALEVLSVVAYTQPATREGIRAIRGVNSDGVVNSLLAKGLIRELGKRDGGAVLYGTTNQFLEKFGLASISDLPALEEFAPDSETRDLIRERLGSASGPATLDDMLAEVDDGPGPDDEPTYDLETTGEEYLES